MTTAAFLAGAIALIVTRAGDKQPPAHPETTGLQNCVDSAIRACGAAGVRSVTYTGGEAPSCTFSCYPPPTNPTAPPPPKPGDARLLSVVVVPFPPHWTIEYVRADGILMTVSNMPGFRDDPLWCEVMIDAGVDY